MSKTHFQDFQEASLRLLEIVNAGLPNKTLYLTKVTKSQLSIERVLDNNTGTNVQEGSVIPLDDSF
ncbi:hypothetical protein [Aquibacillus rhizosphaerae]|uniref:Uncharacterized protein n=1 Tax=Aquibacillus rhizosphaerae TaxID=3051431 RepID=A0ABT7L797_9BACI|nr:hypothetical protein [Aquibacillus sp. LR5S19]MDL4841727.1 hypothetical protein [Aquibacillus sp. LR5S19]